MSKVIHTILIFTVLFPVAAYGLIMNGSFEEEASGWPSHWYSSYMSQFELISSMRDITPTDGSNMMSSHISSYEPHTKSFLQDFMSSQTEYTLSIDRAVIDPFVTVVDWNIGGIITEEDPGVVEFIVIVEEEHGGTIVNRRLPFIGANDWETAAIELHDLQIGNSYTLEVRVSGPNITCVDVDGVDCFTENPIPVLIDNIQLCNLYDMTCDWHIDDYEILDAIDKWAIGKLEDFDLLALIDYWAYGGYCVDKATNGFGLCQSGKSVM